jgi:hypothetical protein
MDPILVAVFLVIAFVVFLYAALAKTPRFDRVQLIAGGSAAFIAPVVYEAVKAAA